MKQSRKKDNRSYAEKKKSFWASLLTERLRDIREGLVNTGIEAQTRNEEGLTSIMVAALNGKQKTLDCLLDYYERRRELRRKGWINLRDDNGRTALMMGAAAGRASIVESLLMKDANHEFKDSEGLTARDHAERKKKADVVKVIDDWLHESDDEGEEDADGNIVNDGLTSTQRSKLKKQKMQALERRGNQSKKGKGGADEQDDSDDEIPDDGKPGPKPVWDEVAKIVESVDNLRPVHEIAISRDEPDTRFPDGVDPALWYLRNINRLELRLAPGALTSLQGPELARLRNLYTLILNDNALAVLPESIGKLKQLKVLEVARNQLSSLPQSLAKCAALEVVDLSFNKLTDLAALKGLAKLKSINVSENQLTELDLDFDNLPNLHDIMATGNKIAELSADFGSLTGLTSLVAENNEITELPVEFCELKKVKVLKLEGNPIKDQKVVKMLRNDARKDLWKYLQKVGGGSAKKGKKAAKKKGKKGGSDDEDDDGVGSAAAASPPKPPKGRAAQDDEDEDEAFFSDDSFDITMDEL